jgi:hypothetical protein
MATCARLILFVCQHQTCFVCIYIWDVIHSLLADVKMKSSIILVSFPLWYFIETQRTTMYKRFRTVMPFYTMGGSNPECWLVKTAFQFVSIPQVNSSEYCLWFKEWWCRNITDSLWVWIPLTHKLKVDLIWFDCIIKRLQNAHIGL